MTTRRSIGPWLCAVILACTGLADAQEQPKPATPGEAHAPTTGEAHAPAPGEAHAPAATGDAGATVQADRPAEAEPEIVEPKPAPTKRGGEIDPVVEDAGAVVAPVVPAAGVLESIDPTTWPKVVVTLNDSPVFALRLGRRGKTVEERVDAASAALEAAVKDATVETVRLEARDGVVIVYVGETPIVQLTEEDANAADDATLDVHAATVIASVRDAVGREQRRREIGNTAFAISLVVLLGLITVYLLRRFHDLADRGAAYLSSPRRAMSSVRMSSIEVIAPGTLRSMLLIGLSVTRWIGSLGVIYAWLIVVLSLFESTRGYTEQLTGYVVNPLAAMMARLAASLPTFVVAFVATLAVAVAVRFVGLFFASVARGEASLSWVPPDLAMALSVPLRVAMVVGALVFAAPIVTGDADGSLSLLGNLLSITTALASVPLLANAVIGLLIMWRRRVRIGERAELGGTRGRVLGLDLWSIRMEETNGNEVHIPHWLLLTHPMRVFPLARRATIEVAVAESIVSSAMLASLHSAPGEGFDHISAVVVRIGDGLVTYRLSARSSMPHAESVLLSRTRTATDAASIVIVRATVMDDLL